jgi:hypothetical protein
MMTLTKAAAHTRQSETILAATCTSPFVRTKEKGRTVSSRTALTTNLHGQNTTPRNTSNQKIWLGKADLHGTRVTARPQTTGRVRTVRDDETAFYQMTASGFFPGNGNVVDRPGQVICSVRGDVPVLALHAMANKRVSNLSHSTGGHGSC